MGISAYSTTPASNTSVSGINLAEGCNASGINDAIRQIMADIASALAAGQFLPTGSVMSHSGASAPTGFLLCDGSAVSRTTYAALFAVITTTYGIGDGSTTFNVPDLRGRAVIGVGTGAGLTARALASTGGEETHAISVAETPVLTVAGTAGSNGVHTHVITDPGHAHSYNEPIVQAGSPFTIGTNNLASKLVDSALTTASQTTGISTVADGGHVHAVSGTTNGSGTPANVMQPFVALNCIIKT